LVVYPASLDTDASTRGATAIVLSPTGVGTLPKVASLEDRTRTCYPARWLDHGERPPAHWSARQKQSTLLRGPNLAPQTLRSSGLSARCIRFRVVPDRWFEPRQPLPARQPKRRARYAQAYVALPPRRASGGIRGNAQSLELRPWDQPMRKPLRIFPATDAPDDRVDTRRRQRRRR